MDKKKYKEILKELQKTLKNLQSSIPFKINKTIIFGSQAKGAAHEESDLDLVIISENFKGLNYLERAKIALDLEWKIIDALDKPVDLLFYSPEEWEKEETPIIKIAKKEGIEVYSDEGL